VDENVSLFRIESSPKIVGQTYHMNTTISDRHSNPVNQADVYYILTPLGATLGVSSGSTNISGIHLNTLTSTIAGSYTITARYNNATGPIINGSPVTVQLLPSSVNAIKSYLSVTPDEQTNVTADGIASFEVTLYAKDEYNNSIPDINMTVSVERGFLNSTLIGTVTTCKTDSNGECKFNWKSTQAGTSQINATLTTNNIAITNSGTKRTFASQSAVAANSTLILSNGPKTADGIEYYIANVSLKDIHGNSASGNVQFTITGGALKDISNTPKGNTFSCPAVNGECIAYWTSTIADNFTISASIGGYNVTNSPQVREFIAGAANATNSIFTITPNADVIADNSSAYTLSVNIKDSYNNKRQGAVVTFRVDAGYLNNGTISPSTITCTTLTNGNCSVRWFSDKIGNFSVNATVDGNIIGSNQHKNFIQGAASNTISSLTVMPNDTRTADNVSYFEARAYIKDALNHNVTDELVTFKITGGWIANSTHNSSQTLTCVTDKSGSCQVLWRSANPGTFMIEANISKGTIGNANREFTAALAKAANSTLEVTPNGPVSVGGGNSYYNITITAYGDTGVAAPGATVTLKAGGGELNSSIIANQYTCNTDSSGKCYFKWTSNISGNFSINATIGGAVLGGNGNHLLGSPQYRVFNALTATSSDSSYVITEPTNTKIADNASSYTIIITSRDTYGNIVSNANMSINADYGYLNNGTGYKANSITCQTNANGNCTINWKSDRVGEFNISVTLSGDTTPISSSADDKKRSFRYDTINLAASQLIVTSYDTSKPDNIPVCAVSDSDISLCGSYYTLKAYLVDASGNNISNENVTFSIEEAGLGRPDNAFFNDIKSIGSDRGKSSCMTDASGSCLVTFKATKAKTYEIYATVKNDSLNASPQNRTFTATTPSANPHSIITFNPATDNSIQADSKEYYNTTVLVRDVRDNPINSSLVTLNVPSGNYLDNATHNNTQTVTCQTDVNGTCSILWRSLVPYLSQNITATTGGVTLNGTRTFKIGNSDANMSVITVSNHTVTTDDKVQVNVTVKDNAGLPINEQRGVIIYTSLTNSTFGNGNQTDASTLIYIGKGIYTATLKSTSVGNTTLTFSVDGDMSTNSEWVYFKHGHIDMNSSNNNSYITAQTPVSTDDTSLVTVHLGDAGGNPIDNKSVNITIISNNANNDANFAGGNSVIVSTSTGGNYTANLGTITAGEVVVSFTVEGKNSDFAKNKSVQFTSGNINLTMSQIAVDKDKATTDETINVNVTVKDSKGNAISQGSQPKVIIYTSLSNSSFENGTNNYIELISHNGNGTYQAVLKSTNIGVSNLTFTIDGKPASDSKLVTFVSGNLDMNSSNNNSYITAQSPVEVGNNSLVTVHLGDSYGNPIDNRSVTIYIVNESVSGTAKLNSQTNVTINQGVGGNYTADLTALDKGSVVLSFIVDNTIDANGFGKNATVGFTTGIPNASNSFVYVIHEVDNNINASADGIDYYTVNVTVRDASNVTVENANITFTVDLGRLSFTNTTTIANGDKTVSCVTNDKGTCTIYWTSLDWGEGNITAALQNTPIYGAPVKRSFQRTRLDDNLTITDFTPSSKRAKIGDLVRYSVKVKNNVAQTTMFDLNNLIPIGFYFVEGSITSTANSNQINHTIIGAKEFKADNLTINSNSEMVVIYTLRVGAGVKKGEHISYVQAFKDKTSISNQASTKIEITGDPMIDESLILGTVYEDRNGNGMQDEGEPGIPGVRIATVEGYIITTDQFGRYHLLNILGGEWGVGRNFIMKVDPSSLPKNSTFTTANPLVRRLTPGLPVRFDFGVKLEGTQPFNTVEAKGGAL
jgi:hypothetical protein